MGSAASTTVQPLLRAERKISSSRSLVTLAASRGLVNGQQVDRADVSAGSHRRTKGEDRAADDLPAPFGDEHAGLRQIDELPQKIGCNERPAGRVEGRREERDEPIDIGNASRPNLVVHADGPDLTRGAHPAAAEAVDIRPARRFPAVSAPLGAGRRSALQPPKGHPTAVLQSTRQCLIYGIAPAATCASSVALIAVPPSVPHRRPRLAHPGSRTNGRRGRLATSLGLKGRGIDRETSAENGGR